MKEERQKRGLCKNLRVKRGLGELQILGGDSVEKGEKPFRLINRDQVRKECRNILMDALYPKGEEKPFITTMYKGNKL